MSNLMNKSHVFYLVDGAVSMDEKINSNSNLIYKLVGGVEKMIETVQLWNERTKTRNRLAGLSDYILQDVGLSRIEADRESHKYFWQA